MIQKWREGLHLNVPSPEKRKELVMSYGITDGGVFLLLFYGRGWMGVFILEYTANSTRKHLSGGKGSRGFIKSSVNIFL